MEIIEYSSKYNENIKDLLVDLQSFITKIDREQYNILTPEYREKYFEKTMKEVSLFEGKIFLGEENEEIVGLIIGLINNDDEKTYDFAAPKRARITELVVKEQYQANGIGKKLLKHMEDYFKSVGCQGILIDVFAYNINAQKFYYVNGYFNRNIELMKKL